MSEWLKRHNGQRLRFRGTFGRTGKKAAFRGPPKETILLKNVVVAETGELVRDHIWMNVTRDFRVVLLERDEYQRPVGMLQPGALIEFDARITVCKKGYWGHDERRAIENPPRYDYQLSRPTKIRKVEDNSNHHTLQATRR